MIGGPTTFARRFAPLALAVLALAFAVWPAAAMASNPSQAQYAPQNTQALGGGGDGGTAGTAGASASGSGLSGRVGPLPFTGFDVLSMAAVALGVTGLGLVLGRAVSRRPDTEPGPAEIS